MSQHTPGPWKVYNGEGGLWVEPPISTEPVICDIVGRIPITHLPEDIQNAHLIAAAPELLDACEKSLELLGTVSLGRHPVSAVLQAAVAKAKDGVA